MYRSLPLQTDEKLKVPHSIVINCIANRDNRILLDAVAMRVYKKNSSKYLAKLRDNSLINKFKYEEHYSKICRFYFFFPFPL